MQGYQPEIWDDIACDECDVVTTGTPIVVIVDEVDSDISGIDFQLTPIIGGTLSGTVVDAADGTTPVCSVIVALIDPLTGEDPPGLHAATDSEGFYEITAIPAGDYKVHFNAVNTANGYVDELYDGIPCDNGGCAMDVLGDAITFAEDEITLDVDLERAFLLSGTVTNQLAHPIAGLNIEVFDEQGNAVCCNGTTGELGEWSMPVPQPGSYYVRVDYKSTQSYVPEIWNDIPCDDCDPVATGDPIVVTDADVGGIDIELETVIEPTGVCGSGDLITGSGFEDLAEYQLAFVGNRSALITEQGQQVEFTVSYLDDQGQAVDPSTLEWCLEDESLLEITPNGTNATITATGFDITSVDLIVRDPVTGASTRGPIILAELEDNVVLVTDDLVIEGATPEFGATGLIRLSRNELTESLQVGMVLITGEGTGIFVRILGVTWFDDYIELLVEPATFLELFERANINTQTPTEHITAELLPDGSAVFYSAERAAGPAGFAGWGNWECTGGLETLVGMTPTIKLDIQSSVELTWEEDADDELQLFELFFNTPGTLSASLGSLNLSASPYGKCTIKRDPSLFYVGCVPDCSFPVLLQPGSVIRVPGSSHCR